KRYILIFRFYYIVIFRSHNRTVHDDLSNIKHVTFYVINFPPSFGNVVRGRNNPNFSWRSRLSFGDDTWQVILDKMEGYKNIEKELKEIGGFAYTYAGSIKRINGNSFCSVEVLKLINKVNHFLSFVRGSNAVTFCMYGYDDQGEVIWKDWSLRRTDRWTLTQDNWFSDQHSSEQLQMLFPGWSKLLDDEDLGNEIPKILYWYCYAGKNTEGAAGTDGSLILAIAALELFSYSYFGDKYEANNLSNNIYKFLKELGIPFNVPKNLNSLYSYAMQKNWQTGPKAIVELRNEIVHPDRESIPGAHVCYEALQLALWYVEMLLLRLCDFNGVYANRLVQPKWNGLVERMPWNTLD
ncbi:MAG: hypothetical protein WD449_01625, partial [Candidatus Babeliales bacterium]